MSFLLDTDILSRVRKERSRGPLSTWLRRQAAERLYLSAITIGEIARGIELIHRRDAAFATALGTWLAALQADYRDRILPVGPAEARRWGELSAKVGHAGLDLFIAATALERGLTVVTGNTRHFLPTGVPVLDPAARAI